MSVLNNHNFSHALNLQALWIIGSVSTMVMSVSLLEWFLAHLAHYIYENHQIAASG
jgi:uncharacterized membrane protein YfbV (UPF0208 family)